MSKKKDPLNSEKFTRGELIKQFTNNVYAGTRKKTVRLDALKNVFNKTFGEDAIAPISGGNAGVIRDYLKAYKTGDAQILRILEYERVQWTNLWRVQNCPELERIWKAVMTINWYYGQVCIKKENNVYIPLALMTYELNFNQDIVKGEAFVNNITFLGATKKQGSIKITNENAIFGKWNFRGIPQIWQHLPFCHKVKAHWTAYFSNLVFKTKKIKMTIRNDDITVINSEIENIFDINNNIIYKIDNEDLDGKDPNEYEVLDYSNNERTNIIGELEQYIKLYYRWNGRRWSSGSDKKERSITAEYAENEVQYINAHWEIEEQLQKLIARFNKKWNFKAELVYIPKLQQEREAYLKSIENTGIQQ